MSHDDVVVLLMALEVIALVVVLVMKDTDVARHKGPVIKRKTKAGCISNFDITGLSD